MLRVFAGAAVLIQAAARGFLARVAHPGLVPSWLRREEQEEEVEEEAYDDDFVVEDDGGDDGEAEWEASLQVSVGQAAKGAKRRPPSARSSNSAISQRPGSAQAATVARRAQPQSASAPPRERPASAQVSVQTK